MPERSLNTWFWVIILAVTLIVTVPFVVILGLLYLPPLGAAIATIGLIILWGVAAGYRDWVISRRREAEEEAKQSSGEKSE